MEQRRLFRSKNDRVIAGVCGGLGEFLNADPVLFRVLFALAAIVGGGVIIYIILWIVTPEKEFVSYFNSKKSNMENPDFQTNDSFSDKNEKREHKNDGNLWAGIILITIGGLFLVDRFFPRINFGDLWPVILIIIGVILISRNFTISKDGINPKK